MMRNQIVKIKGSQDYFNFCDFADEVALCLNERYYILNCDSKLFKEVKKQIKNKTLTELKNWWYEQSKKYEVSVGSCSFEELNER